jgi:hypothetical protein
MISRQRQYWLNTNTVYGLFEEKQHIKSETLKVSVEEAIFWVPWW